MNVYATEAAPHLKTAKEIAHHIDSVLGWWGAKRASEVTAKNCLAYAATKRPQMARADINVLKWALTYWHNDSDYGPLSIRRFILLALYTGSRSGAGSAAPPREAARPRSGSASARAARPP